VPVAYFEVVAHHQRGWRSIPDAFTRLRSGLSGARFAQDVVNAARGFRGARLACASRRSGKDRPSCTICASLQKFCSSRFGWAVAKTLEVAQELYDGQGKKIITYPRAEVRYLPESLIKDVPRIVAGLRVGKSFGTIPVPEPPVIRKGARGSFLTIRGWKGLATTPIIPTSTR